MPVFEIEQYELHAMKYQVVARDEAEAIVRLFDGDADPLADTLEFIRIAYSEGLPVEQHCDLAGKLRQAGLAVEGNVIPSIRSVKKLD